MQHVIQVKQMKIWRQLLQRGTCSVWKLEPLLFDVKALIQELDFYEEQKGNMQEEVYLQDLARVASYKIGSYSLLVNFNVL